MLMGRQAAAQASQRSLSFGWALSQLKKELGEPEGQLTRGCQPRPPSHAPCELRASQQPTGSGLSTGSLSLGCMTPTGSDHGAAEQPPSGHHQRSLSVHWAEALEQHSQHAHAPHHCAPDKPCLKTQQSSFPFVEEVAALESLMRRPRALLAQQLHLADGGGLPPAVQHQQHHHLHAPAVKKRSRLAAFGQ